MSRRSSGDGLSAERTAGSIRGRATHELIVAQMLLTVRSSPPSCPSSWAPQAAEGAEDLRIVTAVLA